MKKFYLLLFLLVINLMMSQTKYVIKISDLSYRINKGVKDNTSSNIRITIYYKNGTSTNAYTRDINNEGDNENNFKLADIESISKPISIECFAFVNFRTGSDADGSVYKNVDSYCQKGDFRGSYSPRMSDITFKYEIEPKISVSSLEDDILPTHTNKTIIATSGYDLHYYRWQYTLTPLASGTQWKDLPKYDNLQSITLNAVDVLGLDAGLHIGKNIHFRIKPCNESSNLDNTLTYSIRLSAPQVNSLTRIQPKCTDSNDGSVQLVFDRNLLNGEQLNYTLFDEITKTPTNYSEVLAIDTNKTFSISGLGAGTYTLQLIGFKDGLNTSIINPDKPDEFALKTFDITRPTPVDFNLSSTNVNCYGNADGTLTINASGGSDEGYQYSLTNGSTWIPFSDSKSKNETLKGLSPTLIPTNTYSIMVRDKNECVAKKDNTFKILTETITQPASPLTLKYTFIKNPTFFEAHNGKLVASVTGGTIKDDKTYEFEWKDVSGNVLPATAQYNATDQTYNITLDNIPAGEYKLTVKDKNYNNVTNKATCSIIESSNTLIQPDPLKIILTETQSISCNSVNTETDGTKFSDGILTASVEGGVPFDPIKNNGLLYKFVWSKFNVTTNQWDILEDYTTAIADNLSAGKYSLNVEDANGIVQGVYNTTALETANPTTKTIAEPTKLELSFTSGNVSCHKGNNGWAIANITGGTGPYNYTWYNTNGGSIDQNKISALSSGTYNLSVTDQKGCSISGSIEIKEPIAPVAIEYEEIFTPTFAGATNGRIIAKITGGTPNDDLSYNYIWSNKDGVIQTTTTAFKNGIYTITLDGVPADDYFLTIKDKNYNEATNQTSNCSIINSKVALTEPDPLKVVFEIIRPISCNSSNEFGNATDTTPKDGQRDESQDGILVAHVTGGTPLASSSNNGLPYYFYWKKQQADGTWIPLPNITNETASNLSHGNYALNIKDRNGIMLGTYTNNNLTQEIDVTQFMQEPSKLTVSITKGDVFCHAGNDGWATAHVQGGTAPYTYQWSNGETIPENTILTAATYWVKIIDARGCSTQASVTISEPTNPLRIETKEVLNPSFYKATNGKIVVEIKGGTIFTNNSYIFEWKNSKGIVQNNTTTSFENGIYTIVLNGLPEENYLLTVFDANYNAATNKTGCAIIHTKIILEDPDPLEVTFEIVKSISCNANNDFGNETDTNPFDNQRDESQDGILKAHVKGGIPLQPNQNNGLPYYFTWKKKQKDGSWKTENNQDETFENTSEGTYALNIEDANGIKLGTYVNNTLDQEVDVLQYMEQPTKLNLTFTKLNASCNNGADGWAEAHVSGGTSPYTYEWTNGGTTARIENITTNNYFVIIKDAKGCSIQGSVFVGDPKGILTADTYTNPTCNKGNDGSIQLNVTGGNLPYTYLWNTGATTKDISALTAGNYEVTITCPDCCVYKKKWALKDPEPVAVDLGLDKTLCKDQVLEINATITDPKAKYSWTATNGFTSNKAIVSLSKAGTYHLKVTSGLGCVGEDEIVIKTSQAAISAEFLVSSQAYLNEEVILINTSTPFGESTKWIIPNGVKVIVQKEKYITLKFDAIGLYTIGLQQTQGDCFATYTKNVTVEKRSTSPNTTTSSQFIIDFVVAPNPSDGNFKVMIALENSSAINLRLFTSSGEFTSIQKKETGLKKYEVDFKTTLAAGMYILVLETEQQTLVKKIIIY
jgi:hypothetical protein